MMTLISPIALCLLLAIIHKISDDITVVTIKNLVQQGEKIFISCFLLFDKYFERFPRSFQEEEQLTAAGGWLKITKIFGTWGIKLVTLSSSVCQNICWGFRQFSGGPPLPPGQCSAHPVILDPWRWEGKRACFVLRAQSGNFARIMRFAN